MTWARDAKPASVHKEGTENRATHSGVRANQGKTTGAIDGLARMKEGEIRGVRSRSSILWNEGRSQNQKDQQAGRPKKALDNGGGGE